jgi:hypothetical protein
MTRQLDYYKKHPWHPFLNKNESVVGSAAFMRCIHAIVHCGAYHKIRGFASLILSCAAMIIKSRKDIIKSIFNSIQLNSTGAPRNIYFSTEPKKHIRVSQSTNVATAKT